MSGLIGGAVRARLAGRFELSALNRRAIPGVTTQQADIADFDAITAAFHDVEVVVHLAGYRGYEWNELLRTNIIGLYNVFEASRLAGVKRVVFASSGATVSGWQAQAPYKALLEGRYQDAPPGWPMLTHETPIRPSGVYGCTKVWGEALASDFSEAFDLSILCLRIGVVTPEDRPTTPAMVPVWCSQRDVAQAVERSILAPPELKFAVFNVVSNNQWGFRDLSRARELIGYEPEDSAEDHPR